MKKSERLNQELFYLNNKKQFNLADIMNEFNISKRTALRDLDDLSEMGLPCYAEAGRYGGYRLLNQQLLPPVTFNAQEVQAIFFALSGMQSLSSNPFEKSFPQVRQKLLDTLPTKQREVIDAMSESVYFYDTAPIKRVANLDVVMQALLEGQAISAVDKQRGKRTVVIQLDELFYRNGIWFCSAADLRTGMWGTYRCDLLSNIEPYQGSLKLFSEVELDQLQDDYEAQYHNIKFKCRVNNAGRDHFLRNHYPNMSLEESADGQIYVVGGYNHVEEDYMIEYLLSYGKNIEIDYPASLKAHYQDYLRQLLQD